MKYHLVLLCSIFASYSQATLPVANQQVVVAQVAAVTATYRITPWKNNAKGAYAIIFDDYCRDGAQGIQDHAAPEAGKRGIVFGFGVTTGACDAHEWQRAREMIAAGHEVINHTHNHRCAQFQSWCQDVWSDADVGQEIDQPAQLIEKNTGIHPTFFIFPYDIFTSAKLHYLQQTGYIGSRTGPKGKLNNADFDNPFSLAFDVKFPPENIVEQKYGLNEYIDVAIAQGQFAFREVHGVADNSWASLTLPELRDHFDYLQRKVASGELWVANVSDIIRYNQARRGCQLESGADATGVWLRLTSNKDTCKPGVSLSVSFMGPTSLNFINSKGEPVLKVNNTYSFITKEIYRVNF